MCFIDVFFFVRVLAIKRKGFYVAYTMIGDPMRYNTSHSVNIYRKLKDTT